MRFAFVRDHAATWPVRVMCRALGVTPAGFYAWRNRPPSTRVRKRASLADHVRSVFAEMKGRYGSPRVYRELLARGVRCTVNTVAAVMAALGLRACRRRRPRSAGPAGAAAADTPHVLGRDFTATRPNEKWVTDVTYLHTGEGWAYLAAVEDLYSRAIVGWAVSDTPDTALTRRAWDAAVARRRPGPDLLVHSDRGCQYTSAEYRRALADRRAVVSYSRKGNCWDNAPMESFFASLKKELVHRVTFATRADAERAMFEYIEIFYNRVRRHSTLGYVAPAAFEAGQP